MIFDLIFQVKDNPPYFLKLGAFNTIEAVGNKLARQSHICIM